MTMDKIAGIRRRAISFAAAAALLAVIGSSASRSR